MPQTAYLALGTNLGNRLGNLRAALTALASQVRIMAKSRIYETQPWGFTDQPAFLNIAVRIETDLSPAALLTFLKKLEADLGRTPTFRNGPRLIDLDILFYNNLILNPPPLVIPHPRLHERAFVLVPLADVGAEVVHPLFKKSVAELLSETGQQGVALLKGEASASG